jgi:hypothetical protein
MPRKLISERQPDGCRKGLGEEGRARRRELATYFRQRTSVHSQKEGTGVVVARPGRGGAPEAGKGRYASAWKQHRRYPGFFAHGGGSRDFG